MSWQEHFRLATEPHAHAIIIAWGLSFVAAEVLFLWRGCRKLGDGELMFAGIASVALGPALWVAVPLILGVLLGIVK